jgi:exosortase/archaeosortase family protein
MRMLVPEGSARVAKESPRSLGSLGSRVAAFLVIFCALQLVWQALDGTELARIMVQYGTVRPAAALIDVFTPQTHVRADSSSLVARAARLNIVNGCDGTDIWIMLLAAFAIAPMSLRARCAGFLIGSAWVFAVNQARVLLLFYALCAGPALFYPLHSTVAPIAVLLLVLGYFYVWLAYAGRLTPAPG